MRRFALTLLLLSTVGWTYTNLPRSSWPKARSRVDYHLSNVSSNIYKMEWETENLTPTGAQATVSGTVPVAFIDSAIAVTDVVVSAPSQAGLGLVIVNVGTNNVQLNDSASLNLVSTNGVTLSQYEGIFLLSVSTSKWISISEDW